MLLTAKEFVELRTSTDPVDYLRAATEPASIEVWKEVILNYPKMKIWVANNKTVPLEILEILCKDNDSEIRTAVAMKNKLSSELFDILSGDKEESVRERLVYNKNLPIRVLQKLTQDPVQLISHRATERLRSGKAD